MAEQDPILPQMEILGSDGLHVGVVAAVEGHRVKLNKSDPDAGGEYHYIHLDCVEAVEDGKVVLNRTAEQAHDEWGVKQVG